jgi:hypothetical protein
MMRDFLHSDDSGLSLVELIVALVIAGMFGGLLVLMFVNGWTAQERSVSRDTATGQANLVKTTMSDSLRNATSLRVSDSGKRLDALVAVPSTSFTGTWTWECRAWTLTDQSIRYSTGSTIRNTDPATWAVLAGKSTQHPSDKVVGTISGAPFALAATGSVLIGMDITVTATKAETVSVTDGMTAQTVATAAETTGAPACWL